MKLYTLQLRNYMQWIIFLTVDVSWGPFLESPGNLSGPKSNIQIEI